ncbi:HNH endonuclease [Primorskyibacter sp. 2E107]|uniref:HNH endonuclease n=1 Tax=Primorskyibacter sp. 2E107 TaxID=3403458 RepID=UPI003AF67A66
MNRLDHVKALISSDGVRYEIDELTRLGEDEYLARANREMDQVGGPAVTRSRSYFLVNKLSLLPMKALARMSLLRASGETSNYHSPVYADALKFLGFEVLHNPVPRGKGRPEFLTKEREAEFRKVLGRPEQAVFRARLMESCLATCVFSGNRVPEALEACHIRPVSEGGSDLKANGILLRRDLHRLFDLFLLSIDPCTRRILVSDIIQPDYAHLSGKTVSLPKEIDMQAVREHWNRSVKG